MSTNFFEKHRAIFEKGGKLGFLHSTYEGFASFAYTPNTTTRKGSHVRDCIDLKRVMIIMVIALLPAFLFGIYNIGYQHNLAFGEAVTGSAAFWSMVWYGFLKILPLYLISYIVGLGIEFAGAQIRGHEINEGYLVTGMLIPLIVPVDVPLWMFTLAVVFAVIVGKEVFGGTGMNIWNPALIARAFLFFSYPKSMSGDQVWIANVSNGGVIDSFSGATPLAQAATGNDIPSFWHMFVGLIPGSIGETSVIAILIGAFIIIYTGIASWKIMVSGVLGALFVGLLANWGAAPGTYQAIPIWNHLVMGGFAFGIVFMATDPVTSAQTEAGKWIYGFLIGAVTIVIRLYNAGYMEGMMLAILLMNTFAPLIDHIIVRRNVKRRLKRATTNK